jgi:hypothetical protein
MEASSQHTPRRYAQQRTEFARRGKILTPFRTNETIFVRRSVASAMRTGRRGALIDALGVITGSANQQP